MPSRVGCLVRPRSNHAAQPTQENKVKNDKFLERAKAAKEAMGGGQEAKEVQESLKEMDVRMHSMFRRLKAENIALHQIILRIIARLNFTPDERATLRSDIASFMQTRQAQDLIDNDHSESLLVADLALTLED